MSALRQSVMLFPFHKQLTEGTLSAREMLRDFRAAGLTGLEPSLFPADATPQWWGELVRAADDLGMEFACGVVGVNLVGESETDRRKALDLVEHAVALSVELHCPTVLLAGSRPANGMSNEEGRKVLSEALAKAVRGAAGSGVRVTIEDFGVYPAFTCSAAHILEVAEGAGPGLGITFDNGNFLFADETPDKAFPLLQKRMCHVHIKDFVLGDPSVAGGLRSPSGKRWIGTPIGAGAAMVRETLALVKGSGYGGWVSLEVGMAPPLEDAVRAAKVVRELW